MTIETAQDIINRLDGPKFGLIGLDDGLSFQGVRCHDANPKAFNGSMRTA